MPIKEDSVLGMMISPEVAEFCLAAARVEVADRGFINLYVRRMSYLGGDEFVKGEQKAGEVVVPVAHEVAGEFDAVSGP